MNIDELQSLYKTNELNDNELFLNSKITKESYVHYKQIIKTYCCLVKQLNLENSLEVCILFTYLLWNGYFSATKTNKFTRERTLSVDKFLALDIMRGSGVCVHYSAMLRDFLNECGYKSACLANIYGKDIDIYFHPNIKRKFGKENKVSKIKK